MNGWIKLHRKIMGNSIWMEPNYLKLWIYCLFQASHKEHEILVGSQLVKLARGQFVKGRLALSEDLNNGVKPENQLNDKTWWRYLKNLEKWEMLSIKSTNKFSVITVVNYDIYQAKEEENVQHFDQQMSNKCPTNDQQMSTNKNVKNVKNDKELNIVINKGLQNNFDDVDLIAERYGELKTIQQGKSSYPNQKDFQAITRIVTQGVPTSQTIKLLEQCFEEFQINNPGQSINSFSYCEKYILGQYQKTQQAERSFTDGQTSNYPSRPRKEGKSLEQAMRELEADRKAWGG